MVQGQYGHKVSETPISHISTTKLSTVAHICHPSYTEVMLRRTIRGCLVLPKKKSNSVCPEFCGQKQPKRTLTGETNLISCYLLL
jgi:hypothetical protein